MKAKRIWLVTLSLFFGLMLAAQNAWPHGLRPFLGRTLMGTFWMTIGSTIVALLYFLRQGPVTLPRQPLADGMGVFFHH